jgi:hypothetical protein
MATATLTAASAASAESAGTPRVEILPTEATVSDADSGGRWVVTHSLGDPAMQTRRFIGIDGETCDNVGHRQNLSFRSRCGQRGSGAHIGLW